MDNPISTIWNNFTDIVHMGYDSLMTGLNSAADAIKAPLRNVINAYNSSAAAINQSNIDSEREAREWEKMMSDTAVQRRVEDIKKAGLNPWLALNGGSLGEASTPSASGVRYDSTIEKQMYADRRAIFQALSKLLGKLTNSADSVIKLAAAAV